jgi:hypothetical protein
MDGPLIHVRSGDLISSDVFNGFIDAVNDLQTRVKALESAVPGGKVVAITDIFPPGPYQIGQAIQVRGHNFAVPANLNTVSVDGILIERFDQGSDDTKLVFSIPTTIQGIPKEVTLSIRNQYGADSTTFTLLPTQQIPQGHLVFTDESGSLGTIQVGNTYVLKYKLDSQTTIAETYQLSPVVANPVGTATIDNWMANIILVDGNGNPLLSPFVRIDSLSPVHVGLKVTIPTGATGVDIALNARSLNNEVGLTTRSSPAHFVVGSAPPVNDSRVGFTLEAFGGASKGKRVNESTIEIPFNGSALVTVQAQFKVAGNYVYTANVDPPAPNIWTISNPSPTQGNRQAGEIENIGVNVVLNASPAPGGGNPEQRSLIVKASRTDSDATGHFDSWISITMFGYTPS